MNTHKNKNLTTTTATTPRVDKIQEKRKSDDSASPGICRKSSYNSLVPKKSDMNAIINKMPVNDYYTSFNLEHFTKQDKMFDNTNKLINSDTKVYRSLNNSSSELLKLPHVNV